VSVAGFGVGDLGAVRGGLMIALNEVDPAGSLADRADRLCEGWLRRSGWMADVPYPSRRANVRRSQRGRLCCGRL
jgi:hypothetical protein